MALEDTQEPELQVGLEAACAVSSGKNRNPGVGSGLPVSCSQAQRQSPTLPRASQTAAHKGTRQTATVSKALNDPRAPFHIYKVRITMPIPPQSRFAGHKYVPSRENTLKILQQYSNVSSNLSILSLYPKPRLATP